MTLKPIAICLYLAFAYWLSSLNPMFKMLFFPTLAAIAFFFMSRVTQKKELFTISTAAIAASLIGSLFFSVDSGVFSFLLACLVTISLILYFKITAAPVLAIAVIPFFTHPAMIWLFPLSICFTLGGLIMMLWACHKVEQQLARLLAASAKKSMVNEELSS